MFLSCRCREITASEGKYLGVDDYNFMSFIFVKLINLEKTPPEIVTL